MAWCDLRSNQGKERSKRRRQETISRTEVEVQRKLSSHDLSHRQLTDPTRRGHSSESNVLILHWVLKSEVLKCQVSICRSKKLLLYSNKRHIYLLQDMAWCTAFRRLRLLGQKRASVMSGGEWPANSSVLTKWRRWRRISGSRRTPHATKSWTFALSLVSMGRLNLASCTFDTHTHTPV